MTVVPGDRVHPSTRELPLLWNRSDLWYTWQTRPTGAVHTVARYRAPTAAAGDGTTTGGTDHPISWCRDYRGGRSFYTGMGRTEAAYAEDNFKKHLLGALEWTAGLIRGDCKATINANYRGTKVIELRPDGHRPRHQRRVARPLDRRATAGSCTSAAATAARTPSAAPCSACRRWAASSTTPTRTSASAAARCTSSTRRSTPAPRTAA